MKTAFEIISTRWFAVLEQTLDAMLDAEAQALCGASRHERSAERTDYRSGHYDRKLHTKAGEVKPKMPKLRKQPFETAIIERYRRRTKVVGAFPDGHSAVMLAAARLRHVATTKWGTRRYLDMSKLREME